MIYLGNKKITDLNYGGTPIKEAYFGSTLVWRKQALEGTHNLHSWVDLGLPSGTLWANMNIGANTYYDYGEHFAFGEISKKLTYTAENYAHYGMAIGEFSGQERFDAARANWGGGWRTPTDDEISELNRYCTTRIVQLTDNFGQAQSVCRIQGTNGKSIYMPLAGYYNGESFIEGGIKGHYWSSTPYTSGTGDLYNAYDLNVVTAIPTNDNNHLYITTSARWLGHTIRPVLDRSSLES